MTGLELLLKQIDEKVQQLEEDLSTGSAKDFSEYKAMCGEIKGLLTARTYVLETKQMVERAENE